MTIDPEAIRAAARRIVLEVGDPEASKEHMLRFEELVFEWTRSLRLAGMGHDEIIEAERQLGEAMYQLAGEIVAAGGWVEPGEA